MPRPKGTFKHPDNLFINALELLPEKKTINDVYLTINTPEYIKENGICSYHTVRRRLSRLFDEEKVGGEKVMKVIWVYWKKKGDE